MFLPSWNHRALFERITSGQTGWPTSLGPMAVILSGITLAQTHWHRLTSKPRALRQGQQPRLLRWEKSLSTRHWLSITHLCPLPSRRWGPWDQRPRPSSSNWVGDWGSRQENRDPHLSYYSGFPWPSRREMQSPLWPRPSSSNWVGDWGSRQENRDPHLSYYSGFPWPSRREMQSPLWGQSHGGKSWGNY